MGGQRRLTFRECLLPISEVAQCSFRSLSGFDAEPDRPPRSGWRTHWTAARHREDADRWTSARLPRAHAIHDLARQLASTEMRPTVATPTIPQRRMQILLAGLGVSLLAFGVMGLANNMIGIRRP